MANTGFRLCLAWLGMLTLLTGCAVTVPSLDRDEVLESGKKRLQDVYAAQQKPQAPLDVQDAVARALLYNLDYRTAAMSEAMAREDALLTSFALWPQLAAGAGYTARDSYAASVSRDPVTGAQTLQPSTASDKRTTSGELQLTWNALDFGVGYLRAKQKGNALHIAAEQRRKAFQNVVQEVTLAWWRALAAQRMEPRLLALRERVESALARSRQLEELRLQARLPVLDYRRDLLLSLKRLTALQKELANARSDLARLAALPPGTDFTLADPGALVEPGWLPELTLDDMQRLALANRAELRELNYRARMAELEGKVAVASLLPSLTLSAGPRYDSNSFLAENAWNQVDAQFSFNLLNLAALPTARRYGKATAAVESLRTDAMTVAVMSQVGIAARAIDAGRRDWCLSRELTRISNEREEQYRARAASSAGDELTQIRSEVEAVLSGLESSFVFADLEASFSMLLNTLGVDPYPENLEQKGPDEVAAQLRSYFSRDLKVRLQAEVDALRGSDQAATGESLPALRPIEELCKI